MIDIISKIFEAYKVEDWVESDSYVSGMADLTNNLQNHMKRIIWILEYDKFVKEDQGLEERMNLFNPEYIQFFRYLEDRGLFCIYNENWTDKILLLQPVELFPEKFTINVVINLTWDKFLNYLNEFNKQYPFHSWHTKYFPASLFANCYNLVNVINFSFPDKNPGLDSIQISFDELFFCCPTLKSVHLENSTRNIRRFCATFHGCKSLKNIPILDISHAITLECMFSSCEKLTSVEFKNDNLIPENQELIRTNMFRSCENLKDIIWDIMGNNNHIRYPQPNNEDECIYMYRYCYNLSDEVIADCGGINAKGTPLFGN